MSIPDPNIFRLPLVATPTGSNKAWSILMRGRPAGSPGYWRHVDYTSYARELAPNSMLEALMPLSRRDDLYRAKYAEEFVQLILRSRLRDRFLAWDPHNAYETATLQFPGLGDSYREITVGDLVVYTSADPLVLQRTEFGSRTFNLSIDTALQQVNFSGGSVSYTLTNGLSSHIVLIPGLTIRLRFNTTIPVHNVVYTYSSGVLIDWVSLWDRVSKSEVTWSSPVLKDHWENNVLWTERLAAFILSTLEQMERAH